MGRSRVGKSTERGSARHTSRAEQSADAKSARLRGALSALRRRDWSEPIAVWRECRGWLVAAAPVVVCGAALLGSHAPRCACCLLRCAAHSAFLCVSRFLAVVSSLTRCGRIAPRSAPPSAPCRCVWPQGRDECRKKARPQRSAVCRPRARSSIPRAHCTANAATHARTSRSGGLDTATPRRTAERRSRAAGLCTDPSIALVSHVLSSIILLIFVVHDPRLRLRLRLFLFRFSPQVAADRRRHRCSRTGAHGRCGALQARCSEATSTAGMRRQGLLQRQHW